MSKSRFVLKQASVGASGASDLTRYVAKNSLDHKREGDKARPLFTERDNDLSHWEARKFLSITGGELEREDLLHYVLSFEQPEDFLQLGETDKERCQEVREMVRHALTEGAQNMGIDTWRWVAGIHLNKPHPHVHILINKHAISQLTNDLARITKLKPPLVAHYRQNPNGAREFDYGVVLNSFSMNIDERLHQRQLSLEKEREKALAKEAARLRDDRLALAQAMLARHEVERLSGIVSHSKTRDNNGHPGLEKQLETARAHDEILQIRAGGICAKFREQNTTLPVPLLTPEELSKLQNAAVSNRDTKRVRTLEKIRLALAQEHHEPARSTQEQGRLAAQIRLTETDLATLDKRSDKFNQSAHLVRWNVSDKRWSLAGVDFAIEKESIRLSFAHIGVSAWLPSTRRAANSRIARLQEARTEIIERINERQNTFDSQREKASDTLTALSEIRHRETRNHLPQLDCEMQNLPAPIYTRAELARMTDRAYETKNPTLLMEVFRAVEGSNPSLSRDGKHPDIEFAARIFAHSFIAKIDAREAHEKMLENQRTRRFAPVAAHLPNGSIVTATLRQFEIRTRAEAIVRILNYSPEGQAKERAIAQAVGERDATLKSNYERAATYFTVAHKISDYYVQEFKREGKAIPLPAFTPYEQQRLDYLSKHGKTVPTLIPDPRPITTLHNQDTDRSNQPIERQQDRTSRDAQTIFRFR